MKTNKDTFIHIDPDATEIGDNASEADYFCEYTNTRSYI